MISYLVSFGKDLNDEQISRQRQWDIATEKHNTERIPYNRNVSVVALIAAVVLLALSLAYEKKIRIIADGVMLGGLFSLVNSFGRGFVSENSQYVFLDVTIGLATVMYLGYHRFVRGHGRTDKSSVKIKQ